MKETLHVYVYRNKNNRFGKVKPYVGGLLQNAPTIATIFFKLETMEILFLRKKNAEIILIWDLCSGAKLWGPI